MSASSADELEFYDAPELAEEQEEEEREGEEKEEERGKDPKTVWQFNHKVAKAEDKQELEEVVGPHLTEPSLADKLERAIDETIGEALLDDASELEGSKSTMDESETTGDKGEVDEGMPVMSEDNKNEPTTEDRPSDVTASPSRPHVKAPEEISGLVEGLEMAMDEVVGEAMLNELPSSTAPSLESSTMDLVGEGHITEEDEEKALTKAFDDKLSFEEHRSQARLTHSRAEWREQPSKEKALQGLEQLARQTSPSVLSANGPSSASPLSSSFWGALSSFKERIYDALDPSMPEGEKIGDEGGEEMLERPMRTSKEEQSPLEGEKSIKSLLERLSPGRDEPAAPSNGGSGGWMDDFDRTFDFASDKLGKVLLGGLKTLETTVGISIEPLTSPSPSTSDGEGREQEGVEVGLRTRKSKETSNFEGKNDGHQSGTDSPNKTPISSSSLYSAGLSTLERLGRTTAGLVVSTKERLTPIIRQGLGPSEAGERLTRQDLKRSWDELFDELSGNQVLERLQVTSAEAATELRRALKVLPPKQLTAIQGQLRGVGSQLDSLRETPEIDWASLTESPLIIRGQEELLERLRKSIQTSLGRIADPEAAVFELQNRLADGAHALSADGPSLLIYMTRSNLANLLSASLHVLLCLHPRVKYEEQLMQLVMGLYGAVSQMQTLVSSPPTSLVDANRAAALCKLISDDCAAARTLFGDAALMLQPMLKWDKYQQLRDAVRDGNS